MATQWFCRVGGKVLGPMPGEELVKKVQSGAVKATTQIRKNDSPWFPAEEVNGLFETAFRDEPEKYRKEFDTEYKGD